MVKSRNLKEKPKERRLRKRALFQKCRQGFLCPKIHTEKKKYGSPEEVQAKSNL
ncbi:MAG: hypothetical protein ACLVIY_13840 [Anaerobutyricum soehngenii]